MLQAEGTTLDDIDLVVRNCYVLPVEELEVRLIYQGDMNDRERGQAAKESAVSTEVEQGNDSLAPSRPCLQRVCRVPVRRGRGYGEARVGGYSFGHQGTGVNSPRASIRSHVNRRESYYKFEGCKLETVKKVWLQPCQRGLLSDEFFTMDGLGALYSRVSSWHLR